MLNPPDIRWQQRFQSFGLAFSRLRSAADLAAQRDLTELEPQGLIQAFEFTHELAWKTLKDFLEAHGAGNLYGSKDATREAFAQNLIKNGDIWMEMIAARNRTSHTYNEKTANQIARAILKSYVSEFINFEATFTQQVKTES